ncbi:MAG: permease [Candidatus Thiodiazotropha sp.]
MFEYLSHLLVYELIGLTPGTPVAEALVFFVMDTALIFFLLVTVIYLMGLLRALLSPEQVRDYVRNKPRWMARVLAILLGAMTPFCSCSSVPLFIGFVEAGIPLGVTFSFLIASPMINEVAAVVLVGLLGWELAALYIGAGLVVAYAGGVIMERFRPERWVEPYVWEIRVGQNQGAAPDRSLRGRHRFALSEVKSIVGRIWKWVIAAIAIGALFHGFVPQEWVAEHLGGSDNIWAVPGAVLLGIPLYANATGVIPVAEAMLGKGVALGTALAFMMSIAALSLPEMLILRKVIKWPALALFCGILAVAIMLVGWGFNLMDYSVDLSAVAGVGSGEF